MADISIAEVLFRAIPHVHPADWFRIPGTSDEIDALKDVCYAQADALTEHLGYAPQPQPSRGRHALP